MLKREYKRREPINEERIFLKSITKKEPIKKYISNNND